MAETRDKRIMVSVEQFVFDKVNMLTTKENISVSTYVRSLIVKDLVDRGLLTNIDLVELAVGCRT